MNQQLASRLNGILYYISPPLHGVRIAVTPCSALPPIRQPHTVQQHHNQHAHCGRPLFMIVGMRVCDVVMERRVAVCHYGNSDVPTITPRVALGNLS